MDWWRGLSLPDRFRTRGRRKGEARHGQACDFYMPIANGGRKKKRERGQLWEREGQRGREGWSRKPGRNGGLGGGKPSWGSVQAQLIAAGNVKCREWDSERVWQALSCVSAESPDPRPPVGSGRHPCT